jgi:serine/threonine protein kinase
MSRGPSRMWTKILRAVYPDRATDNRSHPCQEIAHWMDHKTKLQIGNDVYHVTAILGKGVYAVTYHVTKDGRSFTLKEIQLTNKNQIISSILEFQAFEKIRTLCNTDKKNFVLRVPCPVRMACVGSSSILFLLTYIPGKRLSDMQFKRATWRNIQMLLARLADSVRQLHSIGIAHLDIKSDNFVLSSTTEPYLIDFGLSCITDSTDDKIIDISECSLHAHDPSPYLDPTFFTEKGVDTKELKQVDIYALGHIFTVVLNKYLHHKNKKLVELKAPFNLIKAMQSKNIKSRPSAQEVARIIRRWPSDMTH